MSHLETLHISLKIFDSSAGESAQGVGTTKEPASDLQETIGKEQGRPAKRGDSVGSKKTDTYDAKREEFRKLIEGEYKDAYTREFQSHFNRRFREVKETAEKLSAQQPIIDALCARYGIPDGDTSAILAAMERENNSAEQSRSIEEAAAKREKALRNAHRKEGVSAKVSRWNEEVSGLLHDFPDFDFGAAAKDKGFISMLKAGLPMSTAYEATHLDSIKEAIAKEAAEKAVAQTVEGIRTRGMRPAENGISSQNGVSLKTDMSKLTREERQLLALRAANGERIVF